ncbi:hypothetical protein AVEN_144278-1 [Araneus ventricosus]|uniref:Secreted protein n=1 Tax=Araneus ventricosus TaxID=182803 RepID=A0A4Y2HA67_ARAVE|nr:hypothetical protein AVEN_144278-1 [Araneus ventricosus]
MASSLCASNHALTGIIVCALQLLFWRTPSPDGNNVCTTGCKYLTKSFSVIHLSGEMMGTAENHKIAVQIMTEPPPCFIVERRRSGRSPDVRGSF